MSSRDECQKFTKESQCVLRDIKNYEHILDVLAESVTVNLAGTNGVKFYCVLSDLENYHIIDNPTADTMQDINEGCIPVFLKHFLKTCFDEKLFTHDQFDSWVKCYDFGVLNSANIPYEVNFEKRNLGQNASQSMCLFTHIPFILHKYRCNEKIQDAWKCLEALLKICEIVSSYAVFEIDVQQLDKLVDIHLTLYLKLFTTQLIQKQHFLLHYASIIRAMGPLRHFNMMNIDAKHRLFKIYRHATNNFKSITKTLALQHQRQQSIQGFGYRDNITHGIWKPTLEDSVLNLLRDEGLLNFEQTVYETKFLSLNHYKYSKALMVVHRRSFAEIANIIRVNSLYYFICFLYEIKSFDDSLNSFQVEKCSSCERFVIKFSDLIHFKSYEIKKIGRVSYIISDGIDLKVSLTK